MKQPSQLSFVVMFCLLMLSSLKNHAQVKLLPTHQSVEVNPDLQLVLLFQGKPVLHNKGKIRVYDSSNDYMVDELDMSIPPGPKNTRMIAPYDSFSYASVPNKMYMVNDPDTGSNHVYQENYIGGQFKSDAFHFYPVIMHGDSAIICLHHGRLKYDRSYYVTIDDEVFSINGQPLSQLKEKNAWSFTTKKIAPSKDAVTYSVASDGSGDFNTVQGAIDYIPNDNNVTRMIMIGPGVYEEIVYFRNKRKVIFAGDGRNHTIIRYANNGVFNTKIMSPDPALAFGRHSTRQVFGFDHCEDIQLMNMTFHSIGEKGAQAEALLVMGDRIVVKNVNIEGSGDALQATGKVYVEDSKIQGMGDNVLGYGAVFFKRCEFVTTGGPHIWVRNTNANHGNVLVECTLRSTTDRQADIARAPDNKGFYYPYAEVVLINCKMQGVKPAGWGPTTDNTKDIHYWEYNSTDLNGKPLDVSQRAPVSRQLTMERDAELIKNYSDPEWVLGWKVDIK